MLKRKLFSWLFILMFILVLPTMYVQANEEAPVIETVEVLTPNVTIGETIKVRVKVSDDSNKIETIRTTFLSPNNKDQIFIELNIKESDPIKNTYTLESEEIPSKYEAGKWRAGMIQIRDITGAFTNYTEARPGDINYKNLKFDVATKVKDVGNVQKSANQKDTFKTLKPLTNIKVNHEFTYTFNIDVVNSTFTKQNIYILDKDDKKVPLIFVVERTTNRKKSTVTIAPVEPFLKNSKYTLYIKDIIGKDGKAINQNTKREFTTVK